MMRDERHEERPPYSRLFIVCSKQHQAEDLRPLFEEYGDIEEFHMPKDRNTGQQKGIAYIKYKKTSSAAAAIESLHMKRIQNSSKPIKVMVACNKQDEKNESENKYKRLFIKVPKDATESELKDHFSQFGDVVYVRLQKDRETHECRGFAYINYNTFLQAAVAFEDCDQKFKPVFATPRNELKRPRNNYEHVDEMAPNLNRNTNILPLMNTSPGDYDTILVSCRPCVPHRPLERLFNIIPGMIQFNLKTDLSNGISRATVKYETKVAAAHAVASLNNYEFPSGEVILVQPQENPISLVAHNLTNIVNSFKNSRNPNADLMQLADAITQASSMIKAATSANSNTGSLDNDDSFCSVRLPPTKPMVDSNAEVALRCFLVFKPHPLPIGVLRDVFCRFGDLIDVNALPNKTFGFAKYASVQSAKDAMKTLHNASIYGVTLKVLEAEEKRTKPEEMLVEDDSEYDKDSKRPKTKE